MLHKTIKIRIMKKIIYLFAAAITFANAVDAQIVVPSSWYGDFVKIDCKENMNDQVYEMEYDLWGDDSGNFTIESTGKNQFSVVGDDHAHKRTKAEYKVIGGQEMLLFKDSKGNILEHCVRSTKEWEKVIEDDVFQTLEGDYVDESGVKYAFKGNRLTMGGNSYNLSIDHDMFYILTIDGTDYWWSISTTGINLYHIVDGEYGREPGNLYHRLKNVSPNGRWAFLSTKIVPDFLMWRYNSELIRIMRNEIYARKGYVFSSADLKAYFSKQPWYKPLNNNAAVQLNDIETLNVEILKGNIVDREGSDDMEIEEGLK